MAVGIAEHAGVAAVEGLRRLASDLRALGSGLLDDVVHPLARVDVVREGDTTPAGAAIRDT